jgi:hypothetical protein
LSGPRLLHHLFKISFVKKPLIKKKLGSHCLMATRAGIMEGFTNQPGTATGTLLKLKSGIKDVA